MAQITFLFVSMMPLSCDNALASGTFGLSYLHFVVNLFENEHYEIISRVRWTFMDYI